MLPQTVTGSVSESNCDPIFLSLSDFFVLVWFTWITKRGSQSMGLKAFTLNMHNSCYLIVWYVAPSRRGSSSQAWTAAERCRNKSKCWLFHCSALWLVISDWGRVLCTGQEKSQEKERKRKASEGFRVRGDGGRLWINSLGFSRAAS